MNKKFTKLIAALALLVFMMPSLAGWGQTRTETTTTYTFSSKSWAASPANWTSGKDGNQYTNNQGVQVTTGVTGANATSPISFTDVSKVEVRYCTNASSGVGTIKIQVGNGTEKSFSVTKPSSGGTTLKTATFTYSTYETGAVKITVNCTANSVYIYSVAITTTTSSSTVTAPEISPGSCNFTGTKQVTITPASGTTMYFTYGANPADPDNSGTGYTTEQTLNISSTTTVKAIAYVGDNASSIVTETYTYFTPLTTMQDIYNTANSSNQTVFITFNNWVVSGASSSYAYVTDGTKGFVIINYGGHGFAAGDILSGTAECTLNTYNGNARLSNFTNTATGLTTTTGGTVSPAEIVMADLAGVNCGALVSYNNLTCSVSSGSYYLSDGTTTIQVYTTLYSGFSSTLVDGKLYNITGVYVQSNDKKQICPRSANDIVPVITPATLPFNWAGGGKADLMALQGVAAYGLGSDYATSNAPYLVKFDTNGDYILVRTDSQPDVVTIGVKKFGSGDTEIKVQGSVDGETFTDVETLTFDVSQNNTQTLSTQNSFDANVRYVRIIRNSGANVGVGPISITKYTTDPLITVSPSFITDFSYSVGGGPSTVKSFTVGGSNLGSTTISIAFGTGTNFEMALAEDAATWSSSVSLTPTDGTVSDTPVYVRMKAGLEEGTYTDNVSATWGSLSETVSLSGTVNPAPVSITYNLVTTVTPGKHYIIVSTKTSGDDYVAMGGQNGDFRNPIDITVTSNSTSILSNAGITEIAISGDATNGYTLHATDGYLVGGNKTLKNNGTDSSTWTISFNNSNNVATISAGSYDIKYNSSSPRFNCYASGQRDIYLYEKANDNNCDIYSATNIDSDMTVAGDMTIHAGVVTVKTLKELTVEGTLTNDVPANLIIEDGAQLYTEDVVEATIQKNIEAYTVVANDETDPDNVVMSNGWYFISYPVNCDYTQGGDDPTGVTNLLSPNYDLYLYDPNEDMEWVNYKAHQNDFKLTTGHGYLYANSNDVTLAFAGSLNYYDEDFNSLENGWNLVGNPYTYNAYPSMSYYKMNDAGTAIESTESTGAIAPCTGILVNNEDGTTTDITFSRTAPNAKGGINLALAEAMRGATQMDNAIVSFNEGSQLGKFYFGTQNANLYIPQGIEEYAIVSTEAQGEMPVNFRANEDGQYTLTVNPKNVDMNYLHLIDNMTGMDIDLLQTPSYTFNATTRDYESRFRLVFAANNEDGVSTGSTTFAFYSNGNWIINNAGEATLQVIDVTGRVLSSETVSGSVSKTINAVPGVYMLRLINGENVNVQKIVVR